MSCSKCKAKKLDIWFKDKKENVICGKCYVGGDE